MDIIFQVCSSCKFLSDQVVHLQREVFELKRNIDLYASQKEISVKQNLILEKKLSSKIQQPKLEKLEQNPKITIRNLLKDIEQLKNIIKVKNSLIAEFKKIEDCDAKNNMLTSNIVKLKEIILKNQMKDDDNLSCSTKENS